MFQVNKKRLQNESIGLIMVSLLLTLNKFHTIFSVIIGNIEQVNTCCYANKVNREFFKV